MSNTKKEEIDFRGLRKKSGFTLRKVEELTGISNAYLSQLETGKVKKPSYDTVVKLMALYQSSVTGTEGKTLSLEECKELAEQFLKQVSPNDTLGYRSDLRNDMRMYRFVLDVMARFAQTFANQQPVKSADSAAVLHPDSEKLLKVCFEELRLKMIKNQGKYGWSNEWLTCDWEDECREEMIKHLKKGDPRDVAIYALFMMFRGWSTTPPKEK